MIYLTTGANGAGKTLFTLRDVREKQVKESRPVAYNGRFDLVADFGWKKIDFKDWEAEPDGTIFFVDECHNDMPVRAGQKAGDVPSYIRALGEHRKRGFDFFLITQHPLNIDTFVRRLVGPPGWHRHIKRTMGASSMSSILTWTAVNERCEKEGAGATADVKTASFPKEVYSWYQSAQLHTGKLRIPKQFFVIVACLLLVPVLGWMAWRSLSASVVGHKADQVQPGVAAPAGAPVQRDGSKVLTASEYVANYRPRVPGLMYSAPAYDDLTKPKRVPVPAACLESRESGCKCYTQDATPYPVAQDLCRGFAQHGVFLAFEPNPDRAAAQSDVRRAEPRGDAQAGVQAPAGLTVMGEQPDSPIAPPAPVAAEPQRIATVAANAKR